MVDLLVAWGVSSAAGFVFKEVLAPLAKGTVEDYTKDFFKERIKDFTKLGNNEPLQVAVGIALKEFLQLVQQELEDADLDETQLKQYAEPLKQFIHDKTVKEILGSAFEADCQSLDAARLAKTWNQLSSFALPDEFNWEQLTRRYLKKVKAIVRESTQLRDILDSQNIEAIQQNTKELAGIIPEFNLTQYQEGLRERYSNLNLDIAFLAVMRYSSNNEQTSYEYFPESP